MKGFTLIELLVVVLIIGILAGVALPQYQLAVAKSRMTEALVILKKIRDNYQLGVLATGETFFTDEMFDDTGLKSMGDSSDVSIHYNKNFCFHPSPYGLVVVPGACGEDFADYALDWSPAVNNLPEVDVQLCIGVSDFGKKLCKNVCGAEECNMLENSH